MIFRILTGAVLASALISGPAYATGFSRYRCDNPKLDHAMLNRIGSLKSRSNGRTFGQVWDIRGLEGARTVTATPNKLVCKLTFNAALRGAGRTMTALFTLTRLPNGKVSANLNLHP